MKLVLLLAFAFLANGHPLPNSQKERFHASNSKQPFADFSNQEVFGPSNDDSLSSSSRIFVINQLPQRQDQTVEPVAPAGFEFQNEIPAIPIFQQESKPTIEEELELPAQVNLPSSQPQSETTILQEPRLVSGEQIRFPLDNRRAYIISESRSEPTVDGRSSFAYQTSNGIRVAKETFLDDDGFNVVRGSYSYIDTSGKEVAVTYIADRNGYRTISVS